MAIHRPIFAEVAYQSTLPPVPLRMFGTTFPNSNEIILKLHIFIVNFNITSKQLADKRATEKLSQLENMTERTERDYFDHCN